MQTKPHTIVSIICLSAKENLPLLQGLLICVGFVRRANVQNMRWEFSDVKSCYKLNAVSK